MKKLWILYSIPYENDGYFDNAIDNVFEKEPTIEDISSLYDISEEISKELLQDKSSSDEYKFYFIQEYEMK